jgi:CDP-diacylglycerol pyrophosphatase
LSFGFFSPGAGCRRGGWPGLLLALAALQGCAAFSPPGQSDALWLVIDAGCNQGWAPVPKLQCHPERGDAVLKDRCGETHYLLVPTARRAGVESPELLRDGEPDYFADAWAARDRVIADSGRLQARSDELGLAINSRWGRSQGQLHIHIDFVRQEVRDAIAQWARAGASGSTVMLFGHAYRIAHVASLQRPSPFQRAATAADTPQQREMNTIAVVGDGDGGFYLLLGRADLARGNRGHAEEILVPKHCGK